MGEEWRRGWHPERIAPVTTPGAALVIGGGPAGLEAARALAERGVEVSLAEAGEEWGGRVSREARLPGLAAWGRVRDWRLGQLKPKTNVQMYLKSRLSADDVLGMGIPHVAIATGARWRADGVGRAHRLPLDFLSAGTLTPDDILDRGAEALGPGPVVVFDDDRYYIGSLMAEVAALAGQDVTIVTPDSMVGPFSQNTLEQGRIQARLIDLGVRILTAHTLAGHGPGWLEIACAYTGRKSQVACGCLLVATGRLPDEALWSDLQARGADWADAGLKSVTRIGDSLAPGTIAAATFAGHQYARMFGETEDPDLPPFRREDIAVLR
jgi:dimethylamine/trimethylamine dehydrogenase